MSVLWYVFVLSESVNVISYIIIINVFHEGEVSE
jgi:hypothetical protein